MSGAEQYPAEQPGFQVVPAAYVLLTRGDPAVPSGCEVLLQRRGPATTYMSGHWACAAAGHVEAGESVYAAAVREVREELGVEVSPDGLRPLTAMHRTLPGRPEPIEQRVDFFFTTTVWDGEPAIQEHDKASELRWVRLDALPAPVVPHEEQVLTTWASGALRAVSTFGF